MGSFTFCLYRCTLLHAHVLVILFKHRCTTLHACMHACETWWTPRLWPVCLPPKLVHRQITARLYTQLCKLLVCFHTIPGFCSCHSYRRYFHARLHSGSARNRYAFAGFVHRTLKQLSPRQLLWSWNCHHSNGVVSSSFGHGSCSKSKINRHHSNSFGHAWVLAQRQAPTNPCQTKIQSFQQTSCFDF